ncbi:hypothetical protein ACFYM0_36050 [Streptomyces sp. NPDC006487]|uniref:hypothetical protein n=1 Tax=Streptomyces sp. NPDC006487 TaxID=3364748 RepID=UPI00368E85A9
MADVRADQRRGAPAGAPEGAEVHVENGRPQRSRQADGVDDRGDWKINSAAAAVTSTTTWWPDRARPGAQRRPGRAGYA